MNGWTPWERRYIKATLAVVCVLLLAQLVMQGHP